ncbi:MAG: ABC transporter ATP-binding protein [Rhodobacter sp.]|nr:ABC transporter ATP-binding protein [Rhodobacter sp.]
MKDDRTNAGAPPLLEVNGLTMRFGGLTAINNLSFSVQPGTIHGLIGPNGAGKTTTFNVVSGYYTPTEGRVLYKGQDISGLTMPQVAARGLVRTFQHSTLFQEFSLLQNVMVGRYMHQRPTLLGAILGTGAKAARENEAKARETLAFFGLQLRAHELAAELSHGHQRALGMAVALAAEPDMLLLDEPFTGMNPEETRQMMDLMFKVRDRGVTILLVEHDMQAIMGLCDRITVMNFGQLLVEGAPKDIRNDPKVIEAYLGGARHVA